MPNNNNTLQTAGAIATAAVPGAGGIIAGITSFFSGIVNIRGRTAHLSWDEAMSLANETARAMRDAWYAGLTSDQWEYLRLNYFPRLVQFMRLGLTQNAGFDWWNPQGFDQWVEAQGQSRSDGEWRVGSALGCHLFWIFKNIDADGGRTRVPAILQDHLNRLFPDWPGSRAPGGNVGTEQGGGLGSIGAVPGVSTPEQLAGNKSNLALLGLAGAAAWLMFGGKS